MNSKLEKPSTADLSYEIEYEYCGDFHWLDDGYCFLNHGVNNSVQALNSWFSKSDSDTIIPGTSKGKLRFGWEPRSGDLAEFDFRFRIRVKLPALEDRVELFFSDEEEGIFEQPVKAARDDSRNNRNSASLGVQFKKADSDKTSYRIGIGRGAQIYTQARYKDQITLSKNSSLTYYAEANYYSGDKLSIELTSDYSILTSENSAFQLHNRFEYRDNRDDWFWRHEIQYLILGNQKTSYLFTASINGVSEPTYRREQKLLSFRYKRQVLRDWMYLEVEPFVLWLREENFRASVGIALRTEIHFAN